MDETQHGLPGPGWQRTDSRHPGLARRHPKPIGQSASHSQRGISRALVPRTHGPIHAEGDLRISQRAWPVHCALRGRRGR